MKLKNKKTGEIIEWEKPMSYKLGREYNTVAEFIEDWEDASEEPKKHYEILGMGVVIEQKDSEDEIFRNQNQREIGNYFKSKEEAEKAVEKLKALQRLKAKGLEFDYVGRYENLCGNGFEIPITATMPPEQYNNKAVAEDLKVLFGGEE